MVPQRLRKGELVVGHTFEKTSATTDHPRPASSVISPPASRRMRIEAEHEVRAWLASLDLEQYYPNFVADGDEKRTQSVDHKNDTKKRKFFESSSRFEDRRG